MLLSLSDRKISEGVSFIDNSKKQLIICYCSVRKGWEHVNDIVLALHFDVPAADSNVNEGSHDFIALAGYKEDVVTKPLTKIYINKKYKIPKHCRKVVIAAESDKPFELECAILIR